MTKSMDKLDKNDPRLTAYVLGELEESERRALELSLSSSPDLENEVLEIAKMARSLELSLSSTAPEKRSDEQRSVVEEALAQRDVVDLDESASEQPSSEKSASEKGASEKKSPSTVTLLRRATNLSTRRPARVLAWLSAAALLFGGTVFLMNGMQRSASSSKRADSAASARAQGDEGQAGRSDARYGIAGPSENGRDHEKAKRGRGFAFEGSDPGSTSPDSTSPDSTSPDQALDEYAKRDRDGQAHGVGPSSRPSVGLRAKKCDPRDPLCGDVKPPPPPPPVAVTENPFVDARLEPRSTFSIDVDTASYSRVRRALERSYLPPPSEVRIEELVNYFPYDYAPPVASLWSGTPAFAVSTEVAEAPWNRSHRLLRVGIRGKSVEMKERPGSNLVFLVDVSGSMDAADRLPLLINALGLLVDTLDERDHVALVVYANRSGVVLPSTSGTEKSTIRSALAGLKAGGGTNGESGIKIAYDEALKGFVRGGTNRVILATDGDFNVGVSSREELDRLITNEAKSGVFLSVLGVGTGNYRDSALEALADKGNGNYAYLDSLDEAKKVLVEQASGTLLTIAKDVKIQMTFDPKAVQSFRLIGYENRMLAHRDFADDRKDAGEIGAGHTVTALYEIVPATSVATKGTHVADIALRFKEPEGTASRLIEGVVTDDGRRFEDAGTDFRFAASVAGFGLLLRGSSLKGDLGYADVARFAQSSLGDDPLAYRKELVGLVKKAAEVSGKP